MFIIHSYWGRLSQSLWHICHWVFFQGLRINPVVGAGHIAMISTATKLRYFNLEKRSPEPWLECTKLFKQSKKILSISLFDCIYAKELKSSKTPQQIWSSPDGHQQGGAFRIVQVSRIQLMWRLYLYYQINQIVINLNIHKWKLICWSGKTPGWLVCTSMLEVKYIFSTICEVKQNLGGAPREVRWRV